MSVSKAWEIHKSNMTNKEKYYALLERWEVFVKWEEEKRATAKVKGEEFKAPDGVMGKVEELLILLNKYFEYR